MSISRTAAADQAEPDHADGPTGRADNEPSAAVVDRGPIQRREDGGAGAQEVRDLPGAEIGDWASWGRSPASMCSKIGSSSVSMPRNHLARRGEERLDDPSLDGEVALGSGRARRTRRRVRLQACAWPGRTVHDRVDCRTVPRRYRGDERKPLGWTEGLQHDEQGEADRVGANGVLLGRVVGDDDGWQRRPCEASRRARRCAACRGSTDPSPSSAAGGGPPALRRSPVQPQPAFLQRVLSLGHRAQHPVGDAAQVGPASSNRAPAPTADRYPAVAIRFDRRGRRAGLFAVSMYDTIRATRT